MLRKLIIQGSANKDGDTTRIVFELSGMSGWDAINLNDYRITQYDYQHQNRDDDYLPLMRHILKNYDVLILVTPVYWYAMSGIMKVFFDRFTDLITIEKDLGRQLQGKYMAALSISIGNNLGEAFWPPFRETANYLGMEFIGGWHLITGEQESVVLKNLTAEIPA